ncbi:hypothetical protein [Acaryochloris sp. IP29b_bin.148]|uniref:ATP-grasp domain-containing protein n=1 Tax=Acaryochloris sp. IP29b_bin.148 TaxID=2969218 RepID=UPI00260228F5|nr:hypothetical protein [Acaryochloris sp. IP29b_bin.148]
MSSINVGILCGGSSGWVFEALAEHLSQVLSTQVVQHPAKFNYVLAYDKPDEIRENAWFIPFEGIHIASDKRLVAQSFHIANVCSPQTLLCDDLKTAQQEVLRDSSRNWCLKYPTSTGATGHRIFNAGTSIPTDWPLPIILQEFIELERPEVYRTYCAGGELFGWVVRRNPDATSKNPWVAHARGAQYSDCGEVPKEAVNVAAEALRATGLLQSFGCVDLLFSPSKGWVVLEVGTDGIFNHVDRDLGIPHLEHEMDLRLADTFWHRVRD